ncbi:MAG: methyltransferase domain protein [Ilumatobacteraceae bacterium]|nr:methyltransferase domain protein [Ilumatobacteraceae bacterium]
MVRRVKLLPLSPSRYGRAAARLVRSRLQPGATAPADASPNAAGFSATKYADLYEEHALALTPDTSIGDGDFDTIGRIELAILTDAGLTPSSSLFDFGCGTGRLAVHAVPYLTTGQYVGTDISPTMLLHATALLHDRLGSIPERVRFATQPDEQFPVSGPPDMFCAYSVFTHMEHEDIFRYLRSARTVSAPHTVFVASCLQLDLPEAQNIFLMSAAKSVDERWSEVRNVVTSPELFTEVARLAGWAVTAWHPGSGPAGTMPDGSRVGLGQSIVVMRPN